MKIARASLGVALGVALGAVLAGTSVANAATVRVTGTSFETSPGTCGEPTLTGMVLRIQCDEKKETWSGDISGTGTFDEAISLNLVTGEIRVNGTEIITDACVDGRCGTLESTWHGSGRLDLETGAVILIQGEQRITGGTGSLDGAKGSLKLSLIGDGPATYDGIVVL
jgi:hypothetical protein